MSLMPDELGRKPRVGVFSLTGCAGDQLVILNNEDILLELAGRVEIVSFAMAHSVEDSGELDLALVEGSVCSRTDREVLLSVRARSRYLMAIGTCAVWGGIPAMVSDIPLSELKETVYGDAGALPEAREANPLSVFRGGGLRPYRLPYRGKRVHGGHGRPAGGKRAAPHRRFGLFPVPYPGERLLGAK